MKKILIAWTIFCCVTYFLARPYFFTGLPLLILLLFVTRKNKGSLTIEAPCLGYIFCVGVLLIALIYSALDEQLQHFGFLFFLSQFCKTYFIVICGSIILISISFGIGRKLLNLTPLTPSSFLEESLISIAIGILIQMNIALLLILLRLFQFSFAAIVLLTISFLVRNEIIYFLTKIKSTKIEINGKLSSIIFTFVFITFVSHFTVKLRAVPIEYDSLSSYVNTINNITSYQTLPESWPFTLGFETFIAYIQLLFGPSLAIAFNAWFGLLSGLTVFSIAQQISHKNIALLTAGFFYSIFAIAQLIFFDDKVDLALIFFCLLSIHLILKWQQTNERRWLFFSGLFAGTAFVLKYTAAFLITGIIGNIIYVVLRKHPPVPTIIKTVVLFLVFAGLPFIPWALLNLSSSPPETLSSFTHSSLHNNPLENSHCPAAQEVIDCILNLREADYNNYFNPQHWTDHFKRPVNLLSMVNKTAGTGRTSIDPILIGLLPLGIICVIKRQNRTFRSLTVITSIYLTIWYLIIPEILWYALPGFVLLSIILISSIETLDQAIIQRILTGIIAASILLHSSFYIVNNTAFFFLPNYEDWKLSQNFLAYDLKQVSDFANDLGLNANNKIMLLGKNPGLHILPPYFVNNNRETAIYSNRCQLLFLEMNPARSDTLVNELKSQGITYFLVDNSLVNSSSTPTITDSVDCGKANKQKIKIFLEKHTSPIYCNPKYSIYEINFPSPR
ncbi:glycosyltransferase family 39 protein [Patescibacteria group bacterium]|nr:glycosyltransferase family 39 protein [Patescibacteria group bacterium]MBU1868425.1 glycosyltransferase family 39 protein [Patescibacteria group bacterium]